MNCHVNHENLSIPFLFQNNNIYTRPCHGNSNMVAHWLNCMCECWDIFWQFIFEKNYRACYLYHVLFSKNRFHTIFPRNGYSCPSGVCYGKVTCMCGLVSMSSVGGCVIMWCSTFKNLYRCSGWQNRMILSRWPSVLNNIYSYKIMLSNQRLSNSLILSAFI